MIEAAFLVAEENRPVYPLWRALMDIHMESSAGRRTTPGWWLSCRRMHSLIC